MGWIPEAKVHKFVWKASDNGAVGTHSLGNLPENFVVTRCVAVVKTALTGGGTIICGEDGGGDADGYFTDMDALAAGAHRGTGALVISTGEDVDHLVDGSKDGVLITIATALYSAGEIHFFFEGFQS